VSAFEGIPTAFRLALGSRDQARRLPAAGAPGWLAHGNDWADRFPSIVEAAARLEAHSFLIDGEAVIARDDGH
jgi:hypothetical protein